MAIIRFQSPNPGLSYNTNRSGRVYSFKSLHCLINKFYVEPSARNFFWSCVRWNMWNYWPVSRLWPLSGNRSTSAVNRSLVRGRWKAKSKSIRGGCAINKQIQTKILGPSGKARSRIFYNCTQSILPAPPPFRYILTGQSIDSRVDIFRLVDNNRSALIPILLLSSRSRRLR